MKVSIESFISPVLGVKHQALDARLTDPVKLIRDLGLSGEPCVLLDSAGGSPSLSEYSFLAWEPRLSLTVSGERAVLGSGAGMMEVVTDNPFQLLRDLLTALAPEGIAAVAASAGVPVAGGAFGLLSYDAGRFIERLPSRAADDLGLPALDFIFPRRLICFDHRSGKAHLFFEDAAPAAVAEAVEALERQPGEGAPPDGQLPGRHTHDLSSVTRSNMTREEFEDMVRRARDYIRAGDIFQANLSQRLELEYTGDSLELYRALRSVNPSPFSGFLELGGYQVISSSPERLVQLRGRKAQTRPIAGTRGRGADMAEDDSLTAELNLDPKERAEHIMLVDLERNDMGRVCDYGSVRVDELMVNEAYSHVIHIVSNIRGELHHARDAVDLVKAMFPGGTITGCPKVHCMEIIDELEPVRRGPYTGSFGYIGYCGNMDMNIIIRTLVRQEEKVYAQAGAGIVADSDPEREYHETLRKAEAMVRAVELATAAAASHGDG
ncbi:MAG: anthranilate synthase component I family protein [Gaiellales bacterium]|nr:MAG: anthranilate synthase component I family protein [Gaiellales bacterium]